MDCWKLFECLQTLHPPSRTLARWKLITILSFKKCWHLLIYYAHWYFFKWKKRRKIFGMVFDVQLIPMLCTFRGRLALPLSWLHRVPMHESLQRFPHKNKVHFKCQRIKQGPLQGQAVFQSEDAGDHHNQRQKEFHHCSRWPRPTLSSLHSALCSQT